MGFADVWNRTLVYFGIAEEDDEWDEDGSLTEEDLERTYSERPNVRRLTPRGRQRDFDDWTDPDPEEAAPATAVVRPRHHGGRPRPRPGCPPATPDAPHRPPHPPGRSARSLRCRCTSSCRAASTT